MERGARDAFAARFGTLWCERFHVALTEGDALADALVAIDGERATIIARQIEQGLIGGLASIDEPDEVVASFLGSTESIPGHVDGALIAAGPRAWGDVPFQLHLLSMSAGALVGLYTSPSIASVLGATGRMTDHTERRLRDTARWLSSAMLPGSLVPGEAGYVATVRLRIVHARARRAARRHGHDEGRFGTAINQVDLARTWLAFTLTSMRAQASLGFEPSEASITETYGYWQALGHLLGIDPALIADVRTHADAERLELMVGATSGAPEAQSVMLTDRTLRTVADTLDGMTPLPNGTSRKVLDTLVRRFHGDAQADALAIGRTRGLSALMAPVIALARVHRSSRRENAERRCPATAGRYADALEAALADRSAVPRTVPPITAPAPSVPRIIAVAHAPRPITIGSRPAVSSAPAFLEAA